MIYFDLLSGIAMEGEGLADKVDETGKNKCVWRLCDASHTNSSEWNQVGMVQCLIKSIHYLDRYISARNIQLTCSI